MPLDHDKSEAKTLILIIADAFDEEIELDAACNIILNATKIPKMEFMECFSELVEAGYIYIIPDGAKKLCAVTEKGSDAALALSDGMRYINIEKILEAARREYERIVEGIEYSSEIYEAGGEFSLVFSYKVFESEKFGMTFRFPSRERAAFAKEILDRNPSYFLSYVTEYLDRYES